MKTEEFLHNLKVWLEKVGYEDLYSYGCDMNINTDITIDADGYIYIKEYAGSRGEMSFRRAKTTVNVNHVVEFRGEVSLDCFYIICDDDTGLEIYRDGIYFCIDGSPSGTGTAFEHFYE